MPKSCIFCSIVQGKSPSYKIYEDKEFISFLDINPNTPGMALVIPKEHYSSYVFDMPTNVYLRFLDVTRKVAKQIDERLGVKRTAMVMEGMAVDHAHIKLYPLHCLDKEFQEMWADERVFFDRYDGYVTTLLGPRANNKKLRSMQKKLRIE